MIWNSQFAWEILPTLLRGLVVTLQAVAGGMLLALVLGLIWAMGRRSRLRRLRWPTAWLVEFVRGTPLLIQLYVVYYVLPNFGLVLSPWTAGLLALGLHYSSYTSEVYRAGIEGVDSGQWLAARALNLSPRQTYQHVILPQAIPPILPALGNYLIAMFKDTPMLSAITVLEILQEAKILGNEHFRYLEPFTLVGLFYLAVSLLAGRGVAWLERRLPDYSAS
jgi:polar amino acid transport system permease protein